MLKKVVLVVGIMLFSLESFSQKTDTINKSKKDSVNIPKRAIAYAAEQVSSKVESTIEEARK